MAIAESIDILKKQVHQLSRWVVYLGVWGLIGPVATALAMQMLKPSPPKYFRSTPDGRLVEMVALDRPYLTESQVLGFAAECIYKSYSLDFARWRRQMTEARECYTSDGYDGYQKAIEKSGNLDRMQQDRLVATPFGTGPAVIAAQGARSGVYSWTVQQPVSVIWEASGKKLEQKGIAEIVLVRVPTTERPSAIAVESINLRPGA